MGRGIFCVADCWRDSASRWYEAGINHEDTHGGCCCGCHCGHVFEVLERRVQPHRVHKTTREHSLNLTRILEGEEDEICISPVRLRELPATSASSTQGLQAVEAGQEQSGHADALCPHCCRCVDMKEEGESTREHLLPQVSLFYAMPTFIRELCGVTAFAPALRCRRVSETECACHNLWLQFFNEVMGAYEHRYTSIVDVDRVGEA